MYNGEVPARTVPSIIALVIGKYIYQHTITWRGMTTPCACGTVPPGAKGGDRLKPWSSSHPYPQCRRLASQLAPYRCRLGTCASRVGTYVCRLLATATVGRRYLKYLVLALPWPVTVTAGPRVTAVVVLYVLPHAAWDVALGIHPARQLGAEPASPLAPLFTGSRLPANRFFCNPTSYVLNLCRQTRQAGCNGYLHT